MRLRRASVPLPLAPRIRGEIGQAGTVHGAARGTPRGTAAHANTRGCTLFQDVWRTKIANGPRACSSRGGGGGGGGEVARGRLDVVIPRDPSTPRDLSTPRRLGVRVRTAYTSRTGYRRSDCCARGRQEGTPLHRGVDSALFEARTRPWGRKGRGWVLTAAAWRTGWTGSQRPGGRVGLA